MDNVGLSINIVFTILMVVLAIWDQVSFIAKSHRDFKSILMSLGVLGTFVGVFWGLQDFNVSAIELSVPQLLEGLKTAFYTSIVGMGLAILLAIFQKMGANETDTLEETPIDSKEHLTHQLSKLDHLQHLKEVPELLSRIEKFLQAQEKDQQIQKDSLGLLQKILQTQQDHKQLLEQNTERLWSEFTHMHKMMQETLNTLVEGLGKELVGVLEKVIKDFNLKINDHFGDNFKQLNVAVGKILEWQETYSQTIQTAQESLKDCLHSQQGIKDTLEIIAERNKETLEVHTSLKDIIQTSSGEVAKLKLLLEGFSNLQDGAKNALNCVEKLSSILEVSAKEAQEQSLQNMEKISFYLQQSTQESLAYLKDNMQGITEYLQQSSKLQQQKLKESDDIHTKQIEQSLQQYRNMAQEYLQTAANTLQAQCDTLTHSIQQGNQMLLEINLELKEHMVKNTDALEEHLSGAIIAFDGLLGHTSQKLSQALEDNGELLHTFSKELGTSLQQTVQNINLFLEETQKSQEILQDTMQGSMALMQERIGKSLVIHKNALQDGHNATLVSFGDTQRELLSQQNDLAVAIGKNWEKTEEFLKAQEQLVLENIQKFAQDLLKDYENALLSHTNKAQQFFSSSQQELEQITHLTQQSITQSLQKTEELNQRLCASMDNLDGSLSGLVEGFREDYEWFLRRIQELMGSR